MKLFRTSNIEIVHYCQTVFGCELPSVLLVKKYEEFIKMFACNPVLLLSCSFFCTIIFFLATVMVNKDGYVNKTIH